MKVVTFEEFNQAANYGTKFPNGKTYADAQKLAIGLAAQTNLETMEALAPYLITVPEVIDQTSKDYVAGVAEVYNQEYKTLLNKTKAQAQILNFNDYQEEQVKGRVA